MFEDTHELAENKLLLLYIFQRVGYPISNTNITEIVLENNFLNYFQLQQYLSELVSSNFLSLNKEEKKQLYNLSSKGKSTLEYFENRISESKKDIINSYLAKDNKIVKSELLASSEIHVQNDGKYEVVCKLIENGVDKINIKLTLVSEEKAKIVCSKWRANANETYNKIIDLLS